MNQLDSAIDDFRAAVAILRRLTNVYAPNAEWRSDLGDLSYLFLFAHDPAEALIAATSALQGDPPLLWIVTNQAHALMLLRRTQDARTLYLEHRGEDTNDGKAHYLGRCDPERFCRTPEEGHP